MPARWAPGGRGLVEAQVRPRADRGMTPAQPFAEPPPAAPDPPGAQEPFGPAATAAVIREIIRQREARSSVAPGHYFSDPAWDILLDLTAARLEERTLTLERACRATTISEAAALRWIKAMVRDGVVTWATGGGNQAHVRTSDAAHARMLDYVGSAAAGLRPHLCGEPAKAH